MGSVQSSELLEKSEPDAIVYSMMESETVLVEESIEVKEEEVDPLDKFLPPPPKVKCSEELQVSSFLYLLRTTVQCICYCLY